MVEFQPPPDVQTLIDECARRSEYFRSDEALRHAVSEAPNPDSAYEAMRRIRDSADLLRHLQEEAGHELSGACSAMLLELLAGDQITEAGARRLIEHLKASDR
jgi:hypothetical protein